MPNIGLMYWNHWTTRTFWKVNLTSWNQLQQTERQPKRPMIRSWKPSRSLSLKTTQHLWKNVMMGKIYGMKCSRNMNHLKSQSFQVRPSVFLNLHWRRWRCLASSHRLPGSFGVGSTHSWGGESQQFLLILVPMKKNWMMFQVALICWNTLDLFAVGATILSLMMTRKNCNPLVVQLLPSELLFPIRPLFSLGILFLFPQRYSILWYST